MSPNRLRKLMIAIFFISLIVMIVASYILKDTPREGGFVNTRPDQVGKQFKMEYYPTGEVRAKGTMDGYYKEGEWTYYYKDGTVELVEYYTKGELDSSSIDDR